MNIQGHYFPVDSGIELEFLIQNRMYACLYQIKVQANEVEQRKNSKNLHLNLNIILHKIINTANILL